MCHELTIWLVYGRHDDLRPVDTTIQYNCDVFERDCVFEN